VIVEIHEKSFVLEKRPGFWRFWLKRLAKALLVLVMVAVGIPVWQNYRATKKLQETLAEMDRTEPGWRLEEIEAAREQIPEEENSARVVVSVSKLLPKNWPTPEFHERFAHLPPEEQLAPEDLARLKQELENVRPALDEARKLAKMPRGRHHIAYTRNILSTRLGDQEHSRHVGSLLLCDALHYDQQRDTKKALTSCRAALNAARSLGDEPLSISQLVRNAGVVLACQGVERVLAQGEPAAVDLVDMQKLLAEEDAFPDFLIVARGERAAWHEILLDLEDRPHQSYLQSGKSNWWDNFITWLPRKQIREEHPAMLALLSQPIAVAQLPEEERALAGHQLFAEIHGQKRTKKLAEMILSAFDKVNDSCLRKHAYLRCLDVALAAERYRRANQDWPDSIDNLCPQFLAEVPLDPFDGEPLRYRRVEDGVVIYSVSSDGVDDNGNLDREHPNQPGVDVGCRLWDVARRRQPPRPKPPKDDPEGE
jgi:hypothetical protein